MVTAVRFLNGQEALSIVYSGAKYTRFPPKIAAIGNHFFEWLKTLNSSTACGTVTLKSPLSRAFFTPHVHLRLRKCRSRCTLDCGFKTSESPALRGFEAERCPIRGTSLYLVLKSNGLPRPKIRLKKFGFSLKIVPVNIAKKLPSQRCSQPFLIAFFNFSHKWPTFAFTPKAGTHSAFGERSHTTAHTAKHGAFRMGVVSLYPRTVPHVHKHPRAGYQNGVLCRFGGLVKGAPKERKEPSGQRCAYACRCSEASRPRWAA